METTVESQDKPSRRDARRQEISERILDAAMRLVAEEGYEAFTIARLAGELGYAVGALYRYFKGKDAILAALELRVVEQLGADLGVASERLNADAADLTDGERALLHAMVMAGAYESMGVRRPTHARLLATSLGDPRELLADAALAAGILPPLAAILGQLAGCLQTAAEAGSLRAGNAAERALLLWSSTQGVLTLRKLGRLSEDFAAPALYHHLLESLFVGWGANAETVSSRIVAAKAIVDALPREEPVQA
ncbi:MAG: TetR/AcrR family transcriptional regulator [Myxococcales bacterium]|nr:TetR/AcrR family transcriptional regulator [Myxococcales bacterium]